jgi:hypothetical protein
MSYDRGPSITLLELWERQSSKGNQYFSGYWGNLSVALLRDGERPHPTRPDETVIVWKLVAQERQPRDGAQKAPASPPERDASPAPPTAAASSAGARPDGPRQSYRRESRAAQRERVSAEIASAYGLESDPDDPIPF